MQHKTVQKEERHLGVSSKHWCDSEPRKSILQPIRRTTRKRITTFRNVGLSFLEKITPLSRTKVDVNTGKALKFLKDNLTHEKLIQLIYPYIEKHPEFKDHQNWENTTEVRAVLIWLIEEMNFLIRAGQSWELVQEDELAEYNLIISEAIELNASGYYTISLCFLPKLRAKNEWLHDLLMDMFSQLLKTTHINKWDEQHGEWALEWMLEKDDFDSEEEKRAWEFDIYNHREGIANSYTIMLQNNQSTLKSLERGILNFQPQNNIEKELVDWINRGLFIIKSKTSIYNFCYNPVENEDEHPLYPNEYMFLMWDEGDNFFGEYKATLETRANEYGELPFINYEVNKPQEKTLKLPSKTTFPKEITAFFITGNDLAQQLIRTL